MKNRVLILIMLLLILKIGISYANPFSEYYSRVVFESIGREQGLKDLSVSSVVQDKNGFIWFGTQGGLFRYNGKDTTIYRNNPFVTDGLIHNLIQTMYYDIENHHIWLGTYQGISMMDIETNQFTNYTVEDNGLSNSVVVAIGTDAKKNIWFGTLDGLNRLDIETGKFKVYNVEGKVVRTILLDSRGRLLIGTYEGLFYFDETKDALIRVDLEYPSSYVMVIKEFQEGKLHLGLWDGGVLEIDLDFNILDHKIYADNRVYTLQMTKDQTLWVGTWGGGLFCQKDDDIFSFNDRNIKGNINHSVIYSFLEDQSGLLWIGTNGGGVFKTNPQKVNYLEIFNKSEDPDSLDEGKINTIFRDSKNRLWIAVYNKGLNRYDETTRKIIKYNIENIDKRTLINNQVMDIIEFQNTLYIASGSGVDQYDEINDVFISANLLPEGTISYALDIDNKNQFWVGTYLDGVYEFDDSLNFVRHISKNDGVFDLSDNLVYDIVSDMKGRLWIGTNNGLNVYDKTTGINRKYFKEDGNFEGLASNTVRNILEAKDGTMWIGLVGGGVSKYVEATDTFVSYTEANGLVENTVVGLKEAIDGKIWIATHNGISILDPLTNNIINLSLADGIGGYTFTGEGFKDADGSLLFGGTHGVTRFPSRMELGAAQLPPVYITDFLVYQKPVAEGISIFNNKNYELKADENYIGFEFNAIDYLTLSHIQYSYKLSEVDEDWIESGNRNYVTYSNLSSGEYTFSVRVKTIQGEYTEPAVVTFKISKPWYYSYYAYAFYVFILCFIVYSLLKIRENRLITLKNSELEVINDKLGDAVKELEEVSIKDALTGIFNRRYFNEVLNDHLQIAIRSQNAISLLMIDVDDFKNINDIYGHVFGDRFLIEFARIISENLPRSTDFCARYGGDEFAVVLYDTDSNGAKKIASSIKEVLQVLNISYQNEVVEIETFVSMGIYSVIPDKNVNLELIVSLADEALYEAKKTGKNKIVIRDQYSAMD